METIGKLLLFGGIFIAVAAQLYIIVYSFKVRVTAGVFCLFISPIYAFINEELRTHEKIKPALKMWAFGMFLFLGSVFLLTAVS